MTFIEPDRATPGQASARLDLPGDVAEQLGRRLRIGIDEKKPIAAGRGPRRCCGREQFD